MTRGYPDYQGVPTRGEVTIRQNILFPSGRVLLMDDFETPSPLYEMTWSVAGTAEIVTDIPMTGSGCFKMVTAAADTRWGQINYYMGLVRSQVVGMEFAYYIHNEDNADMSIRIERCNTTRQDLGSVRYNITEDYWEYYSDAGAWVKIPGSDMEIPNWHHQYDRVKLIVDFSINEYVILYVNNYRFDLSGLAIHSEAVLGGDWTSYSVRLTTREDDNKTFYIDNVAITEEDKKSLL